MSTLTRKRVADLTIYTLVAVFLGFYVPTFIFVAAESTATPGFVGSPRMDYYQSVGGCLVASAVLVIMAGVLIRERRRWAMLFTISIAVTAALYLLNEADHYLELQKAASGCSSVPSPGCF